MSFSEQGLSLINSSCVGSKTMQPNIACSAVLVRASDILHSCRAMKFQVNVQNTEKFSKHKKIHEIHYKLYQTLVATTYLKLG